MTTTSTVVTSKYGRALKKRKPFEDDIAESEGILFYLYKYFNKILIYNYFIKELNMNYPPTPINSDSLDEDDLMIDSDQQILSSPELTRMNHVFITDNVF